MLSNLDISAGRIRGDYTGKAVLEQLRPFAFGDGLDLLPQK